jgi:secondary thiamine-phosphate synthase enzyme
MPSSRACANVKILSHRLIVLTRGKGLCEITRDIAQWMSGQSVMAGLLTVFVQHTSASLLIQENADPGVKTDLNAFFARIAPEDNRLYEHTMEGPDDMPAHIRAALTATQLSIPVENGRMSLGTWQGIYLFERRTASPKRAAALHGRDGILPRPCFRIMNAEASMSAKASIRQSGHVTIVDLSGKITLGEGSGLLRSTIKDLVTAGNKNILLNLADVSYLDSAGLGEMVGSYATVTNQGGQIKLLNVQSKVHDLLQITKLYTVFAAFSDEAEAVRSFGASAGA